MLRQKLFGVLISIDFNLEKQNHVKVTNTTSAASVMTRIANQHQQRGLKRFLFCLAFWFVVTQCDYEWVFESVHNYLEPKELKEVEEENVGGNNQLQSGTKISGKTKSFGGLKIAKKKVSFYNFTYFSEFFALKIINTLAYRFFSYF